MVLVVPRILAFLLALPASLLPEPWRRRIHERQPLPLIAATLCTGAMELFGAMVLGAVLFLRYRSALSAHAMDTIGHAITNADKLPPSFDEGSLMGLGATVFMGFLLSWRGALCGFVMAEGAVRTLAGAVIGEATGSAPLALVHLAGSAARAWLERRRFGPLVNDVVSPGATADERVIETCRPRPWHEHTTLAWGGAFYRVVDCAMLPAGPRRLRYRLRALPDTHPIRRPEVYRPDGLLA